MAMYKGVRRVPLEWNFTSEKFHEDPFNEMELDVIVKDEEGTEWKVPAFWGGGTNWRVRFAAPHVGKYTFRSVCTDPEDKGLHGITGELEIDPYTGNNPLYKYGQIRVMPDGKHLMHEDGKPFLWLGDTWWMVFSERINNTDEINYLAKDRADKGFSVIQIMNGLWCDVHAFDRRGKNDQGYCWEMNWERINPYFYDSADMKMEAIVNAGLVPLLAGSWGFYMQFLGREKMKQHYRYMVARYGAYPLMWNIGGETCMPNYYGDSKDPEDPRSAGPERKADWAAVLDYLKEIDPYNRTALAHETGGVMPEEGLPNQDVLDVIMFQGTHSQSQEAIAYAVNYIEPLVKLDPPRPVINGECCYEGMFNAAGPEIQRMIFWNTILKGGAGWTYGAQGVWAASHEKNPFGPSAYGMTWGYHSWQKASQFEGGKQVGASRKYLNKFPWWKLQRSDEKFTDQTGVHPFFKAVCASTPDNELLMAYAPISVMEGDKVGFMPCLRAFTNKFLGLKPGDRYVVYAYDAVRDEEIELYVTEVDPDGSLPLITKSYQEWVYVAEKTTIRPCTPRTEVPPLVNFGMLADIYS